MLVAIDFGRLYRRVYLVFMEYSGLCSHQRISVRYICLLFPVLRSTKFIHRYLSQTSRNVYTRLCMWNVIVVMMCGVQCVHI